MKTSSARIVRQKLKHLGDQLAWLKPEVAVGFESYQKDKRRQLVAERLMQLCVEAAIDACEALIESLDTTAPESARDAVRIANELGAVDSSVATRFEASFVGFRNLLVHDYERIDPRRAFDVATGILRYFPQFIRSVDAFIAKQEEPATARSGKRKTR